MDINVPIEMVLKVEVPMEDYQNEVRDTCVKELENHKALVKRHVKKQIGELLTEDALRRYVGDQLAILVKRDALQAAMSVQTVIRRQIDEQVSECVRSAVQSAMGKLDGRIDRSIDKVVSDAVVGSISRNKLRSMVLDRVNQQDKDGLMSRSIDELELSVRAMRCIKAENIATIGELAERTETELIKIPGLGRKSLREIIEVLGSKGLTLIGSNA